MTDRESQLFERLLCLAANEYGKTRAEMLAWISDDTEDWRADYPKPYTADAGAFIQVSRVTHVCRDPIFDLLALGKVDDAHRLADKLTAQSWRGAEL